MRLWPAIRVREILDLYGQRLRLDRKPSAVVFEYSRRHLDESLGDRHPADVTSEDLEHYAADRMSNGVKPATVNRELAWLRAAFRHGSRTTRQHPKLGLKLYLVSKLEIPDFRMMPETDGIRQGFVEEPDFLRIAEELRQPVRDIAIFAFYSGWRLGEILGLRWPEVHFRAGVIRLPGRRAKSRHGRILPLWGPILRVVRSRADRRGDSDLVFHRFDGQPVRSIKGAWHAACQRAGFPDLLFHDLRRSAIRNFVRAGLDRRVAKALTGHRTDAVFERYQILEEADLKTAGATLAAFFRDLDDPDGTEKPE